MITIVDSPYSIAPVGQKLIIVASSDNTGESGFKYKVVVDDGPNTYTSYVTPNPNGYLVIDVKQYFNLYNAVMFGSTTVHALLDQDDEPDGYGVLNPTVSISEAWIVDGVLEDDPDEEGDQDVTGYLWNATYQASDGYKPNPATRYALNGSTDRWLSDREWTTSRGFSGRDQSTSRVFIPVREADYGVLSIVQGISGDTATRAIVSIFDASETQHAFTVNFMAGTVVHLPFYPANLNASAVVGWEKPLTYPGWRYIRVVAQTAGGAQTSVEYYLYNTAVYGNPECRHDNVRLAWKNFAGGWDYQNFIKRNEESVNVQRKRFYKVLGNFGEVDGSTAFSFLKSDGGLNEREPIVEQMMEVNSDWLTEGEFKFLKSLIVSQQVHWLHDDGTVTPVVIETNDYKMPRERNSKQKQLTLKLKLANDLWT